MSQKTFMGWNLIVRTQKKSLLYTPETLNTAAAKLYFQPIKSFKVTLLFRSKASVLAGHQGSFCWVCDCINTASLCYLPDCEKLNKGRSEHEHNVSRAGAKDTTCRRQQEKGAGAARWKATSAFFRRTEEKRDEREHEPNEWGGAASRRRLPEDWQTSANEEASWLKRKRGKARPFLFFFLFKRKKVPQPSPPSQSWGAFKERGRPLLKPTSLKVKLRPPVRSAYFLSSALRFSFSCQTGHHTSKFLLTSEKRKCRRSIDPSSYPLQHGVQVGPLFQEALLLPLGLLGNLRRLLLQGEQPLLEGTPVEFIRAWKGRRKTPGGASRPAFSSLSWSRESNLFHKIKDTLCWVNSF